MTHLLYYKPKENMFLFRKCRTFLSRLHKVCSNAAEKCVVTTSSMLVVRQFRPVVEHLTRDEWSVKKPPLSHTSWLSF